MAQKSCEPPYAVGGSAHCALPSDQWPKIQPAIAAFTAEEFCQWPALSNNTGHFLELHIFSEAHFNKIMTAIVDLHLVTIPSTQTMFPIKRADRDLGVTCFEPKLQKKIHNYQVH